MAAETNRSMASRGESGYVWDAFISYRREPPGQDLITPWLREVVHRVRYWLSEELGGRPARVFFDAGSLDVGVNWPDQLRQALLTSSCLVPVLSPQYFQSRWCLAEFGSFLERSRTVPPYHTPIILPLVLHGAQWFPPEAQRIQQLDLSRHVGTVAAFWQTARADELDQLLQMFASQLARAVLEAPPFRPDWPLVEPEPGDLPRRFPMGQL